MPGTILETVLIESLTWLGHSGFRISTGRSHVYIDPYRVGEKAPKADVILITHHHYDHFSPRDVELLSHEGTWLIAPPVVAERVAGQVLSIAPGQLIEPENVRGIDVRAIAAYNTSKRNAEGEPFHPREAGGVGYDVRVRGERLYHAGDTDVIPEMDEVAGVDVALLPVSGVYVTTSGEAAEAARRIAPKIAVPMHWGEHIGTRDDALAFKKRAPVEVRIFDKAV
jgi:L-ascorbate metabolism protein UlaG (beta-lactamase superfamily)